MPSYLHPGVYIEEIPSGSRPIEAAATSTAAFVGYTVKGPLDEPLLITKWDEYEDRFGGIRDVAMDVSNEDIPAGDPMGLSVYAFFQNGGAKAYIVRLATNAVASSGVVKEGTTDVVTFTAANPGAWGNELVVIFEPKSTANDNALFMVHIGTGEDDEFEALESFLDLSLDATDPAFIAGKINDASARVSVSVAEIADLSATQTALTAAGEQEVTLSGGNDGNAPSTDDYDAVFSAFLKYRDLNILCLPDQSWPANGSGNSVIDAAISHCETMKNRMVIVAPAPGKELESEKDVTDLNLPTKTYSALYYPWVKVANPYYDAETNPGASRTVLAPPSGFAAGIWAKTDARRGIWKAPAGIETALLGVAGLEYTVEDAEQDYLNPLGVNALRRLPNFGSVIWGTRTLATRADPEWRYIPVRRTAMFIEESVYNGIQWAVFEPNDHRLWSALRVNIDSFMNGLFRAGAFQGEKSSDAYFVRCGLGDTLTQADIDRGQVIVIIGFAPLKPAEFVIVRIQQKVGQA
jgi:phage tail sheath protein FI